MRIDEITEATPGAGASRGILGRIFGGKSSEAARKHYELAKKAYGVWLEVVPRIEASGIDMSEPDTYLDYFGQWMAEKLRTKPTDPIIKDNVIELGRGRISAGTITDTINRMIAQHRIRGIAPKDDSPEEPAAPSPDRPVSGDTAMAGGVEYVWNGSEWRRGDTGEVAPERLAKVLVPQRK